MTAKYRSWLCGILILATAFCSKPTIQADKTVMAGGCIAIEKMTYVVKPGMYTSDGGRSGHVYYTSGGMIGAHALGIGNKYQHFMSSDGGETWQPDPTPESGPYAAMIAWRPNPGCAGTLFRERLERVGQPGKRPISTLERSTDGGKTWQIAGSHLRSPIASNLTEIFSYRYDPIDCNTIYVSAPFEVFRGRYSGLFVSEDAGETFVALMAAQGVGDIPFDVCPKNPATLYAAGTSESVWKSEDGGESWRLVGQNDYIRGSSVPVGPDQRRNVLAVDETTTIFQVLISPDRCDTVYLVTNKGIIRSENGGKTWCVMGFGIDATVPVESMVIYDKNPRIFLVGTEMGIYRTTTGGFRWQKVNLGDKK